MWYYIFILIPNIYLVDVKGEIYSIMSLALTVINHSHGSFEDIQENLNIENPWKEDHLYIYSFVLFTLNTCVFPALSLLSSLLNLEKFHK